MPIRSKEDNKRIDDYLGQIESQRNREPYLSKPADGKLDWRQQVELGQKQLDLDPPMRWSDITNGLARRYSRAKKAEREKGQ